LAVRAPLCSVERDCQYVVPPVVALAGDVDGREFLSIACRMYAAGVWMPADPAALDIDAR
jgi:hypothetical protein